MHMWVKAGFRQQMHGGALALALAPRAASAFSGYYIIFPSIQHRSRKSFSSCGRVCLHFQGWLRKSHAPVALNGNEPKSGGIAGPDADI